MHLNEAFRALNALNEDTFSFSDDGIEKLSAFRDGDEEDDTVSVIDPEAETAEDTADSYVGKVIIDCSVCHSKIYKDKEEVTIDGELANTEEECPYCYSTEGFKVIGEIQPFGGVSDEDPENAEDDEDESEDDDVVQEGIKRTKKGEDEEYKKVTFADVKKGDYVMDHPNDESAKPEKVIKVERDGDDINLIFRHGNWSGGADAPCFVFTRADMKTRKASAKHYAKGGQDEYDWEADENGYYMKRRQQNEAIGRIKNGIAEGYKKVKADDEESFRRVPAKDVKKGDYIADHEKDRAFAPAKVTSVKTLENGQIEILTKNGSMQTSPDHPVVVFDTINMKSRKKDARLLQKKGWDKFDWQEDENGGYHAKKEESLKEAPSSSSPVDTVAKEDKSISESVNNVNVETDDSIVSVSTDENGKVTVSTEPVQSAEAGDEVIAPVTGETQAEIEMNSEEVPEEEAAMDDVEIDDFDEESFDDMEESYLKESYHNVKSYKTNSVEQRGQKLFIEGVITFDNGKQKKTNIVLEATTCTKSGKYSFLLESRAHRPSHKNFNITGRLNNGKFITESASIKRITRR